MHFNINLFAVKKKSFSYYKTPTLVIYSWHLAIDFSRFGNNVLAFARKFLLTLPQFVFSMARDCPFVPVIIAKGGVKYAQHVL